MNDPTHKPASVLFDAVRCTTCKDALVRDPMYCYKCGLAQPGAKADDTQAGGDHYKTMDIQPWQLMEALLTHEEFIGYLKGNLIKYAMRQGKKDSPDADKWNHYNQKLEEIQNAHR